MVVFKVDLTKIAIHVMHFGKPHETIMKFQRGGMEFFAH